MSKELLEAIKGLKGEGKEDLAKMLGIDVDKLDVSGKEEKKVAIVTSGLKDDPPTETQKLINNRVAVFRKMTKGMCLGGGRQEQ